MQLDNAALTSWMEVVIDNTKLFLGFVVNMGCPGEFEANGNSHVVKGVNHRQIAVVAVKMVFS